MDEFEYADEDFIVAINKCRNLVDTLGSCKHQAEWNTKSAKIEGMFNECNKHVSYLQEKI